MNHGFCSEKCQTEYLEQLKLSRKQHFPKVVSEVVKGVLLLAGVAILLVVKNEKLYSIKDSSELNYYILFAVIVGGLGISKFLNVIKSYKSGFKTLGGTGLYSGSNKTKKEIDETQLPEVNKSELNQEKGNEQVYNSESHGELRNSNDSVAPAILCHGLEVQEIISSIHEFENLMSGNNRSKKSRVEIHIYKKETVSLVKFKPIIHPYMFYNMMDYMNTSNSLGFLEILGENYMLKSEREKEYLMAVSERGDILEISKVDGSIKQRNECGFKYLGTNITLDSFSKVKEVDIEIEDLGEFGFPKINAST